MSIKQKLLAGEKIYGTMLRTCRNPAVCYLAKNAGFDFVMFDCEHSFYSFETLHDLFVMGNALGLDGLLRVPEGNKEHVSRSLDCGASGVMVPMTETEKQASDIVKWSKYQPLGERGYSAGGANTNYRSLGTHVQTMEQANERVLSIAQIETKLAVDNAAEIAAVPGIDVLLVGPNDLSLSLGIPGDMMNKLEIDAISHVASCCEKNKKAFGLHAGVKLLKLFDSRLNMIMSQNDTEILLDGFSQIVKNCKNLQ